MLILPGFFSFLGIIAFLGKKLIYPLHSDIKLIKALIEIEDGNYTVTLQDGNLSVNNWVPRVFSLPNSDYF